jgi:hypothetical protein
VIGRTLRQLRAARERGQSMVEMALILPVLVMIVIGTLEFGFVFDHHLTLEYATREGARAGAALAHGGVGPPGCDGASEVDPRIIAAVQRVLTSPGSPIELDEVEEIHIYNADADGIEDSNDLVNIWQYSAGLGPTVDGLALNFIEMSAAWGACGRNNSAVGTQSVGISITYRYDYKTPFRFLFGNGLTMTDHTVMQLNPTN